MANSWGDLDVTDENDDVKVQDDVYDKKIAYDNIFLHCVVTPEGEQMLKALRERLVDRPIYLKGATLEETAYRQGMCDVVGMIDKCVEDALKVGKK